MATLVICPGGWSGGWQWTGVAEALRKAGHTVFTPSFTGMGERVHLASPDIDMNTHIQDLINVLEFEELNDIILVGYSYSGPVVEAVAHRSPGRIRAIVHLGSIIVNDGESIADGVGPELRAAFDDVAEAYGDGWRLPHNPPDAPRRTDHPLKTFYTRVRLGNPQAETIPRTYIHCKETPTDTPIGAMLHQSAQRARHLDMRYLELETGHVPWETDPQKIIDIFLDLAERDRAAS